MPSSAPIRIACIGLMLTLAGMAAFANAASAEDVNPSELTREMILNDPAAPVGGNPQGDVTIVAFEDYNCPFCKKAEPAIQKLVKDDGHIRLVYKDWPILAATSVYAAQVALAAKYQGKYELVHNALMALPGRPDKATIDKTLHKSGVDVDQLNKDLDAHMAEIKALIRRNDAQATGMGFQGTPVFLIGPYMVAAALDYDGFKKVVVQAREKKE
ncbi:MAG TPA: DsbA family protein [Methylovirgula sp.]|jgi:protein-disulfide isomerase|nr:DsbA family protein [Methylovirgula sp.]